MSGLHIICLFSFTGCSFFSVQCQQDVFSGTEKQTYLSEARHRNLTVMMIFAQHLSPHSGGLSMLYRPSVYLLRLHRQCYHCYGAFLIITGTIWVGVGGFIRYTFVTILPPS